MDNVQKGIIPYAIPHSPTILYTPKQGSIDAETVRRIHFGWLFAPEEKVAIVSEG